MSWFSGKVGNLVRDAQRGAHAAAERAAERAQAVGAAAGARNADELAGELEAQARRVNGPQGAVELLARWLERSDGGQCSFPLAGTGEGTHGLAEPLNFHQVMLRSQALEILLESCGRQPLLRTDLLRGGLGGCATPPHRSPGSDPEQEEGSALSQHLRAVVDRLLLPGAHTLWPSLLEVLLLSAASEESFAGLSAPPGGGPVKSTGGRGAARGPEPKCGMWARRVLALIKRSWQSESLPSALRILDRKLAILTAQPSSAGEGDGEGADGGSSSSVFRAGGGMSKTAIRAALARDKLKAQVVKADRLRQRTELLCDACARLEAAESLGSATAPEAERLLGESDEMLIALDEGVKELAIEQEELQKDSNQVSSAMEQQITSFKETAGVQSEKRAHLQEEKTQLLRRLEEVTLQLDHIDEETRTWERTAKELESKLKEQRNHFDDMIAGSFCRQKRLADEKLRAVTCKECAHTALDVVRREEHRHMQELQVQLRKRRGDLRRACAAYLHEERLCVEAAAECLGTLPPAVVKNSISALEGEEDVVLVASMAMQDAWRSAGAVLRRASVLVPALGAAGAVVAGEVVGAGPTDTSEVPLDEAQAFFARESTSGAVTCIDCGLPDADWATVTFGAYLCMDCAGRHRGLGVHLSFVRSVGMDRWNQDQMRRMQAGGTGRFQEFLEGYPVLRVNPRTSQMLTARYTSRAASHYRLLLDRRSRALASTSDGSAPVSAVDEPLAPPPLEGHLQDPAVASGSSSQQPGSALRLAPPLPSGDDDVDGDDGSVLGSVDDERDAFMAAFAKCSGRSPTLEELLGPTARTAPSETSSPQRAPATVSAASMPASAARMTTTALSTHEPAGALAPSSAPPAFAPASRGEAAVKAAFAVTPERTAVPAVVDAEGSGPDTMGSISGSVAVEEAGANTGLVSAFADPLSDGELGGGAAAPAAAKAGVPSAPPPTAASPPPRPPPQAEVSSLEDVFGGI